MNEDDDDDDDDEKNMAMGSSCNSPKGVKKVVHLSYRNFQLASIVRLWGSRHCSSHR